jgi:H+/Cl- antiporter ClcA
VNPRHNALVALLIWLGLGLLLGLAEWPYQLLSELGFVLQRRLWLQAQAPLGAAAALVFVGTFAVLWLAWGPLAQGRGGGLTPVLALQRSSNDVSMPHPALERLELGVQLRRLPLIALTHVAGLTVGVESPSAALGASLLLAVRRRWPHIQAWAALPIPLLAAIGGGAGLGAAFRSPLLGAAYAIEELSREKGL